jgi:hypothetical protein
MSKEKRKRNFQIIRDENMRSLILTSSNKRVEYFLEENNIIKGSGSTMDPLDMTQDDTDIYSDEENPKENKIANKIIDYSLGKRKLLGEKLKVKRSKIKHKVLIPGDKNMKRKISKIRIGIFGLF